MSERAGILLLNLGGPATPQEIRPFLVRLFSDREIIRLPGGPLLQPLTARIIAAARLGKVKANYGLIGGASPILELTRKQARGMEERLRFRGVDARVGIAMRYTSPTSEEALAAMEGAGVTRLLALTLYPHYSKATTGSSLNALKRAMARRGLDLPLKVVDRYPTHSGYLDVLAGKAKDALASVPPKRRDRSVLLFSAHSLPREFIEAGDPYVEETEKTVRGVLDRLPDSQRWALSYQSRSGPVEWVGPDTEEVIAGLAKEGVRDVVVVPVSFVSDHIETLYEIDLLYGEQARSLGINGYRRAESLNDTPAFLDVLADLALEALR